MEVDFVLCCLFMLGLTVCVGLHPVAVNCSGCVCKSSNGATLSLADVFDDPVRMTYNKVSYCFPACLQNNPCGNDTSGLVFVSKDSVQICRNSDIVHVQTDANFTQQMAVNDDHCRIVISCSPPPVQLDGEVVFNVSDRSCGKLKSFVSLANMNVLLISATPVPVTSTFVTSSFVGASTSSAPLSTMTPSTSANMSTMTQSSSANMSTMTQSSSANMSTMTQSSSAMTPSSSANMSTMTQSSSANMSTMTQSSSTNMSTMTQSLSANMSTMTPSSSANMSFSSNMISSSSVTPSSSTTQPPKIDDSDSNKLLYIVIPTAAPVAFIISFATVFCLLNWCHQRNKKKLYIKLTSTIYSEEEDSDNSDDYD